MDEIDRGRKTSEKNTGRVTIPTNLDVVPETIELMKRWGADAIRDCDGTEFPEELTKTGAKIYATYYTTRKDNEWAKANPDAVSYTHLDVYKRQAIICSGIILKKTKMFAGDPAPFVMELPAYHWPTVSNILRSCLLYTSRCV